MISEITFGSNFILSYSHLFEWHYNVFELRFMVPFAVI